MRLGIAIEDTWDFFNEIYADLKRNYQTSLFKARTFSLPVFHTRVNRHLFQHDLQQFMRRNDVVFFEWASRLLAEASHQPKRCGIVTRLHRYEMYKWVDHIHWDVVDKVILVSRAMQADFCSRFPEQAGKTVVISPSTSLTKFQSVDKEFGGDIGILCHLTPRKRVYELILTFAELVEGNPGLHLHIAGGCHVAYGDYHDALHHLVKSLQLQEKVTFYGHITEPWNWYRNIDIFVSNSYSEGLQVAPMEAMASGCYCLSHRWNGADELLPEENLYYTDTDLKKLIMDYCALSAAEQESRRSLMRQLACEKFDIRKTIAEIRQVIHMVGMN